MSSGSSSSSSGIGLGGALFILFLGLKLTGYIDWSWWWVTAPLWGPLGVFIVIAGIVVVIAFAMDKQKPKSRR